MGRCWIMSSKRWGDTDETAWEVEWFHNPPVDPETGDSDVDRAPRFVRWFKTHDAAMRFARKTAASPDVWGHVAVVKQSLECVEDNVWDWENVGQVEYVER